MLESTGYLQSDQGRVWHRNDDAARADDDLGVYLVADGMGGHAAGDVASSLAADRAMATLHAQSEAISDVRAGRSDIGDLAKLAARAIRDASEAVWDAASGDSAQAGMGTTLTILIVAGTKGLMAHVGHSRLYLVRSGGVHQLSSDHTMTAELLASGAITPAEASAHPFRNALTRAVGTQPTVRVDTLTFDVLPDDRFLLCTDGLWSTVSDARFYAEALDQDADAAAVALVEHANASGGRDNITAIVVDVSIDEAAAQKADYATQIALSFDALRSVFMFESLNHVELTHILNACALVIYQAGASVRTAGETSDALFIVVDGQFEIERDGRPDGNLGPGDHIGETTLLAPRDARATVTAIGGGSVLVLTHERFRALTKARPHLGVGLLARLSKHLSRELDIARAGAARTAADGF